MASVTITHEEWFAELERIGVLAGDADGATVTELVDASGRGDNWVRNKVRLGIRAGVIEIVRKQMTTIDGRQTLVPAYRMIGVKGKKK